MPGSTNPRVTNAAMLHYLYSREWTSAKMLANSSYDTARRCAALLHRARQKLTSSVSSEKLYSTPQSQLITPLFCWASNRATYCSRESISSDVYNRRSTSSGK